MSNFNASFSLDTKTDSKRRVPPDYKHVDELRRNLTPNGRMQSRKRTGYTAEGQKKFAMAIKRARFMVLLPYSDAVS
ncbi:MAG: 30S ribosomal protein S18 [Planctomycetota bacterium]|nr:30S ribosomal protein S18 [Planctomycetota bacterium]